MLSAEDGMVSSIEVIQLGILSGLVFGLVKVLWWLKYAQHCEKPETNQKQIPEALPQQGHQDNDASQYWSRGYGRFKYCGLRDDPFAENPESESPGSSSSSADICPPDLSKQQMCLRKCPTDRVEIEQKEKLSALANRVTDLTSVGYRHGYFTDPSTLLRYLRARNGNVAEAEKLIRRAVQWRAKHDIDRVFTHWNLAAYERCLQPWFLSGGFLGHSRTGQPVAYERLGRAHFAKLSASLPWDDLLKCDIVHCERCVAAMEEDAIRRGVPLRQVLIVMDMDGFGWDQMQYSAGRTLARLTENRTLLLTELTYKILVIRVSEAASRTWALFKHLLEPGSAAKVEVVTTEKTLETLREYIDDASIPAYLGGSKTIDGDPECRSVLAPGGLPPPDAMARMSRLIREEDQGRPRGREKEMQCCFSQFLCCAR